MEYELLPNGEWVVRPVEEEALLVLQPYELGQAYDIEPTQTTHEWWA